MASLLAGALKLAPAVIDGLTHEYSEMKRDRTPLSLKRSPPPYTKFHIISCHSSHTITS